MSNQQSKLAIRTGRPQSIAGAIGGLMRIFGVRASDADLVNRWGEIMGPEIADIAQIAAIRQTRDKRFNIVLRPRVPAYALQLSYMAPEITNKINKYFGRDAVAKISFRK